MNRQALAVAALSVLVALTAVAAALAFGGPTAPPAMASINDPFKGVDFSGLPPLQAFTGDDGTALAYRAYRPAATPRGSVVLVHGSSASSNSMHVLAQAFARAGYAAYALDMRGHGGSGRKGTIAYVGQLEDDLAAFVRQVAPPAPSTLLGFSAGGGFVLRFAASERQDRFASYLLLSPYLGRKAPTFRPGSGGWVDVGVPRAAALSALNAIGITAFNDLPVAAFALNDDARRLLTPTYSFALAANFGPRHDDGTDIAAVQRPCAVLVGADDEAFVAAQFEPTLRRLGKAWPVAVLPGVGHIPLTLAPTAVSAAVSAVEALQADPAPHPTITVQPRL